MHGVCEFGEGGRVGYMSLGGRVGYVSLGGRGDAWGM